MQITYVSVRHVLVDSSGQWRRTRGGRVEAGGGRSRHVVAVSAECAQVGVPGGSGRGVTRLGWDKGKKRDKGEEMMMIMIIIMILLLLLMMMIMTRRMGGRFALERVAKRVSRG